MNLTTSQRFGLLTIAVLSSLLLSPKWFHAVGVWIYYPVLLLLLRHSSWRWWLGAYAALLPALIVSQLGVIPLPFPQMAIFFAVGSSIGFLPYLIDRVASRKLPTWAAVLAFPVAATVLDLLTSNGPQGTWGNNAYTQFHFRPLMQLAAVTGIFGINFLYYWFASVTVNAWESRRWQRPQLAFALVAGAVIFAGTLRLSTQTDSARVSLAAIHLDNKAVYEAAYTCTTGEEIEITGDLSPTSEIVAKVNEGFIAYLKDPVAERYAPVHLTTDSLVEAYAAATSRAAQAGARVVTWSEATILTPKTNEAKALTRASKIATDNGVYLFYPTAVFRPEMVESGEPFLENKVLTFGPDGTLLNTYFKNIPVMGVEPSVPGDGTIPVINTPFGNLSPIICYDADHPQLIRQVSTAGTDLLVCPTGDWQGIAPLHTYMAAVRCIENGTNMLKATNEGTSALIDYHGNMIMEKQLNGEGEMLIGRLPSQGISTPYAHSAPIFGSVLLLCFLGLIGWLTLIVLRACLGFLRTDFQ